MCIILEHLETKKYELECQNNSFGGKAILLNDNRIEITDSPI